MYKGLGGLRLPYVYVGAAHEKKVGNHPFGIPIAIRVKDLAIWKFTKASLFLGFH